MNAGSVCPSCCVTYAGSFACKFADHKLVRRIRLSEFRETIKPVSDEPQTTPCRCGATQVLFSKRQDDDTSDATYWYLCGACATRTKVEVIRLPDEPGEAKPRWLTTSTEYPPPRTHANAESPDEALGKMTCHCGATLEIEDREEIGPVTVFALRCPKCGRALSANVERQAP